MEKRDHMLSRIQSLSEADKLELFSVEELESRLEMAAVAEEINGSCGNKVEVTANGACW